MTHHKGEEKMKQWISIRALIVAAAVVLASTAAPAYAADATATVKVGVVNFKQCVEKSKLGKQEAASFEALKTQAEQVLQGKEKELAALAQKLDDADYLDSLSHEAEAELKHKFRALNQEMAQQQQQLYQTLSQANFKIVQKLTDAVSSKAKEIGQKLNLNLVINEDACFYYHDGLDITDKVISGLDEAFDKQTAPATTK